MIVLFFLCSRLYVFVYFAQSFQEIFPHKGIGKKINNVLLRDGVYIKFITDLPVSLLRKRNDFFCHPYSDHPSTGDRVDDTCGDPGGSIVVVVVYNQKTPAFLL